MTDHPHPATPPDTRHLAVFISPHGFGHASRASAVMEALLRLDAGLHFEIFSQAPAWFFDSLPGTAYRLHPADTDVGLVQKTPMVEDLPATLLRLEKFTGGFSIHAEVYGAELRRLECQLVLCDISPLGLAAAHQAGIPSVLVENFTWDWIYKAYAACEPGFSRFADLFEQWFSQADLHIQTQPVCSRQPSLPLCTPASRLPRLSRGEVRSRLKVAPGQKSVLVSLGSLLDQYPVINMAMRKKDWVFFIPDASDRIKHLGNLVLLPQHFDIHHPDLANAADALVAKAGYSTIAEAWACGVPFGYLTRPQFPESPCLEVFLQDQVPGFEISERDLQDESWLDRLEELATLPRRPHLGANGADKIASLVQARLP